MNSDATAAVDRATRESILWARTLVVAARPAYGSPLWVAQHEGSRAVVACLDGDGPLAQTCAYFAAHAAFEAVPGLRG